jgi:hypothetical protein
MVDYAKIMQDDGFTFNNNTKVWEKANGEFVSPSAVNGYVADMNAGAYTPSEVGLIANDPSVPAYYKNAIGTGSVNASGNAVPGLINNQQTPGVVTTSNGLADKLAYDMQNKFGVANADMYKQFGTGNFAKSAADDYNKFGAQASQAGSSTGGTPMTGFEKAQVSLAVGGLANNLYNQFGPEGRKMRKAQMDALNTQTDAMEENLAITRADMQNKEDVKSGLASAFGGSYNSNYKR